MNKSINNMRLISIIYKILVFIVLVLLFGYCETKFQGTGIVISVLITLSLIRRGYFLTNSILLALQSTLYYYEHIQISYLIFFLSVVQLLYLQGDNNQDEIELRPYEKEIRSLLYDKDSNMLHKVDDMLLRHKYHEKELYQELLEQYQNDVTTPVKTNKLTKDKTPRSDEFTTRQTKLDLPGKDRELLEQARQEARNAIQERINSFKS